MFAGIRSAFNNIGGYIYVVCKVGDKRLKGWKEGLSLFDGMVINWFDPLERYSHNNLIGQGQGAKAYAYLKCPKSWINTIVELISEHKPTDIVVGDAHSVKDYRNRKGYIDFAELETITKIFNLESDLRTLDKPIPVIDCMGLTTAIFKDALLKDFLSLPETPDYNASAFGTFTWGDTGAGDDFDKYTDCVNDIAATVTGNLTYQHNHSDSENSWANITETINDGVTLRFTNNSPQNGNPTIGNVMTIAAGNAFNFTRWQAEGQGILNTGTLQFDNIYYSRPAHQNNKYDVVIDAVAVQHNIKIHDNLIKLDKNATAHRLALHINDNTPIIHMHNNEIWTARQAVYTQAANGANLYENNVFYNTNSNILWLGNQTGEWRNNIVAGSDAGSCWFGNVNADGYNNASSDVSGEDADFNIGNNNNNNIVIANEVLGVDDTQNNFLDIREGGVCQNGGMIPSIPENTAGIRGRARPHGALYTIGAAEWQDAPTPPPPPPPPVLGNKQVQRFYKLYNR